MRDWESTRGPVYEERHKSLHVCVDAEAQDSLGASVKMVESLLIPVEDEANEYKHSRLLELAKLRQRVIYAKSN